MTKNAVELRSVSFTYAGFDAPAVDDVSLAVAPGECIVLCGESGCGKTTATRIVNGLAGGFYEGSRTGEILVASRDIDDLEDWELSSLTGSVFQNPRTQFFNLDTTGEIAFGMENLGVPRKEMHRRVRDVVRELGIECLMGRGIFELSGGQMQSVAFASAWACKPSVYVLDEPSSNLDPPSMEKLASFISKAKSSGSAVIIAEHRLSYLASVADRYLLFEGGSVAAEWDAQRFLGLSDAERESCGLRSSEPPKLADLMQRLSRPASAFPAVEARGIYAGYERGVPVLEGITVSFDPGRVVGVVGRNGAGKSTLLKCLAGIKKEELGHVRFQGSVVPPKRRPNHAFLVMQDPDYQLFRPSVRDELASAAPSPSDVDELRLEAVLEEFGLGDVADRHPASLSGGQKQRTCIASALASEREVIVYDEPTSGLDFANMQAVARELERVRDGGTCVTVITHDYEFIVAACDEVAVVADGRVSVQEPLERANLAAVRRMLGFDG